MTPAVIVDRLSKEYRISAAPADTMLQERVMNAIRRPFRRTPMTSVWALKDVSFALQQGEVLGIIGRNGAGKSTLLKVLSRITYPTGGRVSVRGRIASLLEVGTGFHEELTGRENIFLNGSILGMSQGEIRQQFDAIVDFSGVERFLDTPIKRYSSGMRVRLGFAVAAHVNPDVLIVDEVLAVGDAGFQKKCLDTMQDSRAGGRTVLFVSHQMAAVENLCSRGIWIDGGQVKMDGPVGHVVRSYLESFATGGHSRSLEDATARRGSGEVRFTSFEVLEPDGQPKSVVRCGDPLTFRFHYHANEAIRLPSVGLRLFTELGILVTDTSTSHHAIQIPTLPAGDGHIDLELDALTLVSARYTLSLFISHGLDHQLADALEHCTTLDVDLADVYGGGRTVDARAGIAYFPQHWRLNGVPLAAGDVIKTAI